MVGAWRAFVVLRLKNHSLMNCPNPFRPAIFKIAVNKALTASFTKQIQSFCSYEDFSRVAEGLARSTTRTWWSKVVISRIQLVQWIAAVVQLQGQ